MNGLSRVRLWQMIRKELRQMLRDPRSKRMLFAAPIAQLIMFGYAVNTDVRNAALFVVDLDRTAVSRELVSALTASGHFRVVGTAERPAALVDALDHGHALVGLEIPAGFTADIDAGRPVAVQLLVDGTTANTANVALGYATQIVARFARAQEIDRLRASGLPVQKAGVDFRARAWYNPDLVSRVYNVPAVMGTIMLIMGLLLTSLAVVREREMGTLEQLMVSPLRPAELILGKTLPVVFVSFVQLLLIVAVALFCFDIPLRGGIDVLLGASFCFTLSCLGLGLFISTVSNTQQEAFMAMFFFLLPAIMLSGFMFPIQNMPEPLQPITLLNPLRHYLVVVRGVFLRGAGWTILWSEILTLFLMGVAALGYAAARFRKTSA